MFEHEIQDCLQVSWLRYCCGRDQLSSWNMKILYKCSKPNYVYCKWDKCTVFCLYRGVGSNWLLVDTLWNKDESKKRATSLKWWSMELPTKLEFEYLFRMRGPLVIGRPKLGVPCMYLSILLISSKWCDSGCCAYVDIIDWQRRKYQNMLLPSIGENLGDYVKEWGQWKLSWT